MKFSIVTPEEVILDTEVRLIQMQGLDGWFEVMENHAPIISALQAGKIRYIDMDNQEKTIEISGGFFGMENNEARITLV